MFATTLSVRTTISGRAPMAVDNDHVVIVDRSGMNINVHKNNISTFPQVSTLKVGIFLLQIELVRAWTQGRWPGPRFKPALKVPRKAQA